MREKPSIREITNIVEGEGEEGMKKKEKRKRVPIRNSASR